METPKDKIVNEEIYARSVRQYFKGQKPTPKNNLLLTDEEIDRIGKLNPNKKPVDLIRQAQLSKILNAGYVKLSDDQSLPNKLFVKFKANPELTMPRQREIGETAIMSYEQAQQDMLEAGWRKVVLEEKE